MEIENSLDSVKLDETPVVLDNLVKTTKERGEMYCKTIKGDGLYFVSVSIPQKHLINVRGRKISWLSMKQHVQYIYLTNKLINVIDNMSILGDASIDKLCVVFEQHLSGCIHFHMIIKTSLHKHDVRAMLASMLQIRKPTEILLSIRVVDIKDIDGVIDYLFHKKEKLYEELNMNVYKPLIKK